MSKAENTVQLGDGGIDRVDPMQEVSSDLAGYNQSGAGLGPTVSQSGSEDCVDQASRSLLSPRAEPKGRRSFFRR